MISRSSFGTLDVRKSYWQPKTDEIILTIKVVVSLCFGQYSSGKSKIIASTEGNQPVPRHENVKIGLNIYKSYFPIVPLRIAYALSDSYY